MVFEGGHLSFNLPKLIYQFPDEKENRYLLINITGFYYADFQ